ncbi:MAG: hypothetical protein MUQ32_15435, partial [Chloroflexi bacterium]|nr:hypothetical protein [Chloroflexota bacterium]
IPEEIRRQLKLVLADTMDQVLDAALRRSPQPLEPVTTTVGGSGGGSKAGGGSNVRAPFPPADHPGVVVQGTR